MKRLDILDFSRLFAALCVLFYHYFVNGITNGKITSLALNAEIKDIAKYGYLGVEFFFMISGYVIFNSASNKSAGEFAAGRALRLLPAFWAAIGITSLTALQFGNESMQITTIQVAANLTMFPQVFGHRFVDGVYWTLQYEILFYLLIFGIISLGYAHRLQSIFIIWPFLMLGVLLTPLGKLPLLGGYYAYFGAGALLAILRSRRDWRIISSILAIAFVCLHFELRNAISISAGKPISYNPTIVISIVCLQFIFFILLNIKKFSSLTLPGARAMGGITYPLYLIHAHIGYMLLSKFASESNKYWMYPMVFAIVILASYALHLGIEQGLKKAMQRLFLISIQRPIDRSIQWICCKPR